MRQQILALIAFAAVGCSHVSKESLLVSNTLVGIYERRDVVDTEERLTLSADRTFTYDFMPLGQTGQSYGGRWESKAGVVTLTGKLESGEEENFPLEIGSEKGVPILTYTWASLQHQRATMIVPSVFVRSSEPNQSSTAQRP